MLALYLLLAGLMPNMDFCDLARIPDLVEHYLEHQAAADGMDLAEFITFHYAEENKEPADDHSLPFKEHNCCPAGHTLTVLTRPVMIEFRPAVPVLHLYSPYQAHLPSRFSTSIWQPPQFS